MTNANIQPTENLRVFVSSTMSELGELRGTLNTYLHERGIYAWVFEVSAGARPENVVDTSLKELDSSDIYVGIFWKKYGSVTVEEFRQARATGKPCFIYIRGLEAKREARLENFLQSDIYDLSRGVTYSYFETADSFCSKVSNDILAWLTRQHRDMTALIKSANLSEVEVERLQSKVVQLQSTSQQPLPSGTAADYLAYQLKGWFSTIGYSFENYDVRETSHFEWVINVPNRRNYDRVLVRGVTSEASLSDLLELHGAVATHKADEGWLVANRRVSQSVREAVRQSEYQNLFSYTLDELIDQAVNFDTYFEWLNTEVSRRFIDTRYVHLAATKDEINLATYQKIGISHYDERNGGLDGYVDRWLDDPSKEHLSILGEFGTGKTWFCLHYAWKTLQQFLDAKARGVVRPRIPIYIPLRDYSKAATIESLLSEFFFRKHEITLPHYTAFEQLNRMGKLLLILDGFDEMAMRNDPQTLISNFWELARVVTPGAKVILTARNEYFPTLDEKHSLFRAKRLSSSPNLTGKAPQFEVLELEMLNKKQIRQILSHYLDDTLIERALNNRSLMELLRRPIVSDLIWDALPEIGYSGPVSLSIVYLYAIRRKMERDTKMERTFTSLADKLYFLCELSWEMFCNDKMSFNYRDFSTRLIKLFGSLLNEQKELEHWHYDMMSQTLLVHTASGDYSLAHRSFLEFFVAYKLGAEMGVLSNMFCEIAQAQTHIDSSRPAREYTWKNYYHQDANEVGRLVYKSPLNRFSTEADLNYLVDTVGRKKLPRTVLEFISTMIDTEVPIWNLIRETRNLPFNEVRYLPGNMVSVLKTAGADISGKDFSYLCLAGADFSDADLQNSNFTGSSLIGSDFSNANLASSIFVNSHFRDVSWGESGGVYSLDISSDDRLLVAGIQNDGVLIWDIVENRVAHHLAVYDTIYATKYSHNNNFLMCTTRNGDIYVWAMPNYKFLSHLPNRGDVIESACFSKHGNVVYYTTPIGVNTIDIFSGEKSSLTIPGLGRPRKLAINYQADILAVSSAKGSIAVIDETSLRQLFTCHLHEGTIRGIDIDLEGRLLATGGKDGIVTLTKCTNGERISSLKLDGAIFSVAFKPQGDHLAVSFHDQKIAIIKLPELQILDILQGHAENVRELLYSHDGSQLYTASYDGTIIIWSTSPYVPWKTVEGMGKPKKRLICREMDLRNASGLTEEYISFFSERGAIL